MHAHIFPQKVASKAVNAIGNFYDLPMQEQGYSEDLIVKEKEAGVSKGLICSSATTPMQVTAINSFIASEVANHPDEFFGFGTLHAYYENIPEEVERIIQLGLKGIKLHPDFQNFAIDDPKAFEIYAAAEGKLPILFHTGDKRYKYSNPDKMMNVLKNFPKLTVICAHLGGYSEWKEVLKLKGYLGNENVFIDTSSSIQMMDKKTAVKIIKKHGIERTFWGSDYPMWTPKTELNNFLSLGFTDDENEKILGLNAINLLNIN